MIKTILVPVTGAEPDRPALATAVGVARIFDANIRALHPRFDPTAVAQAAGVRHPTGAIGDLVDRMEHAAAEREAAAAASLKELCARERLSIVAEPAAPPSVQWLVGRNDPRELGICGMTVDLIVASRPSADDPTSRSIFNALLFRTGRPVLVPIAAPSANLLGRIGIAWKPTAQAARALAFAMPFLSRAGAVTVLTAAENDARPVNLDPVIAYLGEHGVRANARYVSSSSNPDGEAAAILAAADDASMLVMGAYGRSRFEEWVFGGFTRFVLGKAKVPVLMAH